MYEKGFLRGKCQIRVVKLTKWLDMATGKVPQTIVALPMIQRGSVWKPQQIIDLWDSLLQGMPIGSLMAFDIPKGTDVRRLGHSKSEKLTDGVVGVGLLDGQQRTMAMLLAWPKDESIKTHQKIWVDFADTPWSGRRLRLRVTTKNQPFGYSREERKPNDRPHSLSLDQKTQAYENFKYLYGVDPDFERTTPYLDGFSLPMGLEEIIKKRNYLIKDNKLLCDNELISYIKENLKIFKCVKRSGSRDSLSREVVKVWDQLNEEKIVEVEVRIKELVNSLQRMDTMYVPIVRVNNELFEHNGGPDETPPLAILFSRIGTSGTPLSDEDYIYSMIKHFEPRTHDLVETLHGGEGSKVASPSYSGL